MKLIDGDKLRAKCIDISKENEYGSNLISKAAVATLKIVIGLIDNYPTVEAVHVVHGYWIEDNKYSLPKCSICGKRSHSSVWHDEDNFCGHCGAKMDEERKEND